ncbi:MAG: methyltransferase domain-containing protein [Deltaproteobacteria bacterium]|nr:methyltransferase domain-containing protein [Deltaproteobacteria bacterium]
MSAPLPTVAPNAPLPLDAEAATRQRYAEAARVREAALCCPVDYDPRFLAAIPKEVIERDYGCGDPSRHVRPGDTVLDLGSGGGKICFIASQITGPTGRVIGVDMNDAMLALARSAAPEVAARIGHANVEFRRGRIQDLALDVDRLEAWLAVNPVKRVEDLASLEEERVRIARETPLVADASVDLVVSNCVLNLVREQDKRQLLREIHRVLRPGGRIAISDIVSDEEVPEALRRDPELWSGCVSGAFQELDFLEQLEAAGFYGIAIEKWESTPFAVVDGIEFRSVTITAKKGKEGPCMEAGQAVVYRGPWKAVVDDDGHTFRRGVRTAVCAKTFRIMTSEPYAASTIGIEPAVAIPADEQPVFDCLRSAPRHPRETKGGEYRQDAACAPGACC